MASPAFISEQGTRRAWRESSHGRLTRRSCGGAFEPEYRTCTPWTPTSERFPGCTRGFWTMTAPAEPPRSPPVGRGAFASWLAANVVLVVADAPNATAAEPALAFGGPSDVREVEVQYLRLGADGGPQEEVLVGRIAERPPAPADLRLIRVGRDGASIPVEEIDLRSLLRARLAALSRSRRERDLQFVAVAATAGGREDGSSLGRSLTLMRDALREPRPRPAAAGGAPRVDVLARVDERAYFLRAGVGPSEVTRLAAVSPEGETVELSVGADARQHEGGGQREFLGCFRLRGASLRSDGWLVEVEVKDWPEAAIEIEIEVPRVVEAPLAVRDVLLAELDRQPQPRSHLVAEVAPAIARVQRRLAQSIGVEEVHQLRDPVADARVAAIVPVGWRDDLVEHQLASFAADPGTFGEFELTYVVPRRATVPADWFTQLSELYGVSFRVAVLSSWGGFAASANTASGLTRADWLLLMGPGVLPRSPAWLDQLLRAAEAAEVGGVAPTLLAFDDAIHAAGMDVRGSEGGLEPT